MNTTDEGFSLSSHKNYKLVPTYPRHALLLAPFFARSLTLVPLSLLLNRTEMLATQAKLRYELIAFIIFKIHCIYFIFYKFLTSAVLT